MQCSLVQCVAFHYVAVSALLLLLQMAIMLKYVAVCCSVLQCVTMCCSVNAAAAASNANDAEVCCRVLHCVTMCCSVNAAAASSNAKDAQGWSRALQSVAVQLLQCVAVCCSLSTVAAASIANDAHVDCMYMETKKQCNALLTDLAGMLRSLGVFCGKVWERVLVGQILPSYPL